MQPSEPACYQAPRFPGFPAALASGLSQGRNAFPMGAFELPVLRRTPPTGGPPCN